MSTVALYIFINFICTINSKVLYGPHLSSNRQLLLDDDSIIGSAVNCLGMYGLGATLDGLGDAAKLCYDKHYVKKQYQSLYPCDKGWLWDNGCDYEAVQEGIEQMKSIECAASLDGSNSRGAGSGVLFESGFTGGALIAGTGSFGRTNEGENVDTHCVGVKFDISFTVWASITWYNDYDDIFGSSIAVEIGLDVPFTEFGIDKLMMLNTDGICIGAGLAFGGGLGVNPLDVHISHCDTSTDANRQTVVGIESDTTESGWECPSDGKLLGIISEGPYVCCKQNNAAKGCYTGYCWFTGKECPKKPLCAGESNIESHIATSFCPGMRYMSQITSKSDCQSEYNGDWKFMEINLWKFMKWYVDTNECWVGDGKVLCGCVYAPTIERVDVEVVDGYLSLCSEEVDCGNVLLSDPLEKFVYIWQRWIVVGELCLIAVNIYVFVYVIRNACYKTCKRKKESSKKAEVSSNKSGNEIESLVNISFQ